MSTLEMKSARKRWSYKYDCPLCDTEERTLTWYPTVDQAQRTITEHLINYHKVQLTIEFPPSDKGWE